jgi:putative FmdB family regulatory protein
MPIFNFKCDKCNYIDEYIITPALAEGKAPDVCPKCKEGKMEKLFSPPHTIPDIIGGYDYLYGKKAWKRNMSLSDQAKVIAKDENGKYKDPW